MHPNLSFDQAPPISVPFRFFLTAPLFGVAAGLWLAWQGGDAWVSRWSAEVLALTHLFSVGFMLQAMCGALLQFVPVAAGGNVWRPRFVANLAYPSITLGGISLVAGFATRRPEFFQYAVPLLAIGLTLFVAAVGRAVVQTPAKSPTIRALRMALVGLVLTLVLGLFLAVILGWQLGFPDWAGWTLISVVNVHAAWGLGGWALMLVIGVSYLVVPMFQLTPQYPVRISRWLPVVLLLLLMTWSLQLSGAEAAWGHGQDVILLLGFVVAAIYAGVTLKLQKQRRRKVTDVTFHFWRGAMLSLLALPISWLVLLAFPELGLHPRATLWLGVILVWGVFVAAINGMLYKIVPFVIWLHLQNLGNMKSVPPNMKQMIPERMMRGQFVVHVVAFGLLLAAVVWPVLAHPAGLAVAASMLWLEWNLVRAVKLYQSFRAKTLALNV